MNPSTQLSEEKSIYRLRSCLGLAAALILALPLYSRSTLQSQTLEGAVVAWGRNDFKQADAPPGLTNVTAVAIGTSHSLALKQDGSVVGWGTDGFRQVTLASAFSNVVAVAAGDGFSLVLKNDGTAQAWGRNDFGQASVPPGLSNIVAIAAGSSYCLALKSDRTVSAWGVAYNGNYLPMNPPGGLTNVVSIAVGACALALKADGTLVAWGDNSYGQTNVPSSATNVVAIAGSLALKADGSLVAWGDTEFGQTSVPPNATNVVAIAVGAFHSLALRSDHTIVAWGWGPSGETNIPPSLTNAFAISAGGQNSLALANNSASFVGSQPNSLPVYSGTAFNLVSGIAGIPGSSYQWNFEGVRIPGATNKVLQLTNIQPVSSGNYSVTVTDTRFAVSSSNLTLSVLKSQPVVLDQPTNQTCAPGETVTLSVGAVGSLPFYYQWRLEGSNVIGATNAVLELAAVGVLEEGNYDVVISNDFGLTTSSRAFLNVLDLNEALDATNLTWVSPGDALWHSQGQETHDGMAAAQSGVMDGAQRSALQTTIAGPGTLNFWWNVDCQGPNDYLAFSINEVEQSRITGHNGWQLQTVYLGLGEQTLDWAYIKTDASVGGRDAGWLDQVSFVPGGTPPLLTLVPQDQVVLLGASAILSGAAVGTPPLNYQWQLNLTNLPGATNTQLAIQAAQFADEGDYTLVVGNPLGQTNSTSIRLNVVDLPEALNETNLVWFSAGDRPWLAETWVTHDGRAALQSGPILDNQSSTLKTAVNGPGTLSFWWQVSSETNADFLCFSIDGVEQSRLSGLVNWRRQTFYLTAGSHVLSWIYSKNATLSRWMDHGWLDEVRFVEEVTPAAIDSNPMNQVVPFSGTALFAVGARGTPPLRYQWQFNSTAIPDATNAVLIVPDVQVPSTGAYSVLVTNDYGRAVSTDARLDLQSVFAWGAGQSNTYRAPNFGQSIVPSNITHIAAISAGGFHSLALRSDGLVLPWGYNGDGETNLPVALTNVAAISAGLYHNLALQSNGLVSVWGSSAWGQTFLPSNLTNVAAISAGWYHNLALKSNGTVVAWGAGTSKGYGYQQGQSMVPPNLTGVTAVAAGGFHSLALGEDGKVVAWGWNASGQTNVPPGLGNVMAIAAGASNSLALKHDGTVVAWGDNTYGQTNIPPDLTNVVAISAGAAHCLALKSNGALISWGLNGNAQTVFPEGLSNITAISAGVAHSLALANVGPVTFPARPWDEVVFKGQAVSLAPVFLGASPMSYQWFLNGSLLPNATNAFLSIASAQSSDSGAYRLAISNSFGVVTTPVSLLTVNDSAPSFSLQPTNVWTVPDSSVMLAAIATGVPPLSYQWLNNGVAIDGATNNTFAIVRAQFTNEGVYALMVSNAYGRVTSSNVFLDVLDLVQALEPGNLSWADPAQSGWFPEAYNVYDGNAAAAAGPLSYYQGAVLDALVTGPGTISFWWANSFYVDLTLTLDGATVLTSIGASTPRWNPATVFLATGNHSVAWIAINRYYMSQSGSAFLDQVMFTPGPTAARVTAPLLSQTNLAGTDVTLSIGAEGTPPLTYQWFFNGVAMADKTAASFTITNAQAGDTGEYAVIVTNDFGQTDQHATLLVNPALPSILSQPSNWNMVRGGTVPFAVFARGSEPLNFQWQFNGEDIPGATGSLLLLTNLQADNSGTYRVVVTNSWGAAVSTNVSLALVPTVVIGWGSVFVSSPTPPLWLTNVCAISAGDNCNAALKSDGTVYAWGWNAFGKLAVPAGLTNVCSVSVGGNHGSTLINDGTVVDWGDSFFDAAAVVPAGLSNVVRIAAGDGFNLALKQDGRCIEWGRDSLNLLSPPPGLSNVVEIGAGHSHALALTRDRAVVGWGSNGSGEIHVPAGLSNVIGVAAGWFHSMALKEDGSVVAWGRNYSGQANIPPMVQNVVAIAAGADHCLALQRDGTVIAWGGNTYGQSDVPFWLTRVVAIAAGTSQSLALLSDGSPFFTRQPWSQTVLNGSPTEFHCSVLGDDPLSYQWQVNGKDVQDATNATLRLQHPAWADSGYYRCVVRNPRGTATTFPAMLTVLREMAQDLPVFGSLDTNGAFKLSVSGLSGQGPALIMASTNFSSWTAIFTNPPTTGSWHFCDPESMSHSYRFYRAIEQ